MLLIYILYFVMAS